jgi:hypothetical protein
MAKGTLLANATTTKKGGSASTAKNGKSSIVAVNQDRLSAPTTKKARTSKSTSKTTASIKKEVTPIHSSDDENAEGSGDEVVLVNDGKSKTAANGPRHLDLKSKKYDKHYRAVTRDALEGMPLCECSCCLFLSRWVLTPSILLQPATLHSSIYHTRGTVVNLHWNAANYRYYDYSDTYAMYIREMPQSQCTPTSKTRLRPS